MPEGDGLPGFGVHTQLGVARQILAEVDHRLAVGGTDQLSLKALLLENGHALGGREIGIAEILYRHAVPAGDRLQPGVVGLTLLEVVFPRGPLLAGLPALVAAEDGFAVDLQLAEQGQIGAIIIPQAVDAHAAAVPAVAQGDGQLVFTGAQQSAHVIALHREALGIVPGAGGQHEIAHALPVQCRLIEAVAGDEQNGAVSFVRCKSPP